jgi:valyl-tRNA synthetase
MPVEIPPVKDITGLEEKWVPSWEEKGVYRFRKDRVTSREQVFSIDTPPPTVSGSLHLGHVFSYTHTDLIARYKRMRGFEVFYPMGWDDNGLPTERRVQNYFKVICDPNLPYEPGFVPDPSAKEPRRISRPNFVELCHLLTRQDEAAFEELWRTLGLSVDWSLTYATIDPHSVRTSQASFLRLVALGRAYQAESPTLWDVDFRTAVAQAELKDVEVPGAYHRIRFELEGGASVEVDTTRPELLAACVALVAHPDDPRYAGLAGATATTPVFKVRVPIHLHPLAEPEKGTGIAMVCTFGDLTDVTWWRELGLPLRSVLSREGTMAPVRFGEGSFPSEDPDAANKAYSELVGLSVEKARANMVEILARTGSLVGEPRPIKHTVKFFEKGDRPLEIMPVRQWFIRILDLKDKLIELGRALAWHPSHMRNRFEAWVSGLSADWNISRQRFFGVPFPVWYPLDEDGSPDYGRPILARQEDLPVDPSVHAPPGYAPDQRDKPGGFTAETDVMDTWATSALTPQIAGHKEDDPELFRKVFPMDLRPQGHEIIRTWLFVTLVKSYLEEGVVPWRHAAISGWVLDPDRKKMSKSVGNVITPMPLLKSYGPDAVRYWAAKGRPGTDTAIDENQIRVGRRLAVKILNAAKFCFGRLEEIPPQKPARLTPLDEGMLSCLAATVERATEHFEAYDYTRALESVEDFFWDFCDNYIELVKARAYGEKDEEGLTSARYSLHEAMRTMLLLFAPFLPFTTEEVWSWVEDSSVHSQRWPSARPYSSDTTNAYEVAKALLSTVRRAKTEAKKSVKAPVTRLVVRAEEGELAVLDSFAFDLRHAANAESLEFQAADGLGVEVEF